MPKLMKKKIHLLHIFLHTLQYLTNYTQVYIIFLKKLKRFFISYPIQIQLTLNVPQI